MQSLRSFEAVARLCSMMRAAEELCVTQSAVGQQIRKLEEWFGLPLIERSGRGIRLTEAGERFKVTVCEAFNLIHGEAQLLRRHDGSPLVRVSCASTFATSWLLPQMHNFWAKHREVQLAIQYSQKSNAPDPTTVDVAVRMGRAGQFPNFVAKPILESATFPFASPDYLQRVGYNDLSDLPRLTLLHNGGHNAWRDWLLSAAAMSRLSIFETSISFSRRDSGHCHPKRSSSSNGCSPCLGAQPRSAPQLDSAGNWLRAVPIDIRSELSLRNFKE
ncbi:LysR family transcriptional regulator [Bradyrhizobium sp. Arg62]|uniref:LysR family transcriptional regulator n=1 Tax=Bradyrhizobium brasilense TaxID=1419277 RepID=UPI001E580AAC|nr:LysR family transcriptional regulator [Bradyrhizobium brasilense]MCC8946649.1 LysR family transcriptional regulator [Bradyrhizobium brasilense]